METIQVYTYHVSTMTADQIERAKQWLIERIGSYIGVYSINILRQGGNLSADVFRYYVDPQTGRKERDPNTGGARELPPLTIEIDKPPDFGGDSPASPI